MTICYKDDWAKYPSAIIDDTTNNETFLRYASSLEKMGVQNNLFPLALYTPELKGIDPFSPDLDPVTCNLIFQEAKYNFWYYLREIARIPIKGTAKPSKFLTHRGNMAFCWAHLAGVDVNLTLPRQSGKSVGADCINNWHINISGERQSVQLYTKDNKLRKENVERMKGIRDAMPEYVNFFDPSEDSDNMEEVSCNIFKNKYQTAVAQMTEDGADKVGRGLTSPIIQADELPFCNKNYISIPAALGSMTAVKDFAIKNGTYFGFMITTTAGKKDTAEGKFAYDLIHSGIDWTERVLDCANREELIELIKTNAASQLSRSIINITLNHRQLGKTDAWLRDAIINTSSDKSQAQRDFLNVWTSGSISSPLSDILNEKIRAAIREPDYMQITGPNYMMSWYISQHKIDNYMRDEYFALSIDSSSAQGADANGMTLTCLRDLRVVATTNINETSLNTYAIWVASLLIKYPNITLIIERASSGPTLLDIIVAKLIEAGIDPFTRIYNKIVDEGHDNCKSFMEINNFRERPCEVRYVKYKKAFGFVTNGKTREHLYNTVFRSLAKSTGHLIYDKMLSEQIRSLIQRNDRIDHPAGSHDDLVIAWLLSGHLAGFARNLAFYGIPNNYVMTAVSEQGSEMTQAEILKLREQSRYRELLEDAKEQLRRCSDSFQRAILELRLRKLVTKIDDESGELNVDTIMKECTKDTKPSLRQAVMRMRRNGGLRM